VGKFARQYLRTSGREDKADLWVVRAKDSLSTMMELLQGIEHHVDQEQEAVEKRQSLTPQASFNTSREKSSKRVVLRSGRDLLP
jgi:hypothetical protein